MTIDGEYEPSSLDMVAKQVETYERTGGKEASTFMDTGLPVIIVTSRGAKSGKIRKVAVMRVEHAGEYALVASMGGAPKNPAWHSNLKADSQVMIQDGPVPFEAVVEEIMGDEKAIWWERAVAAYPPYAAYQEATSREIPIFLARPRG